MEESTHPTWWHVGWLSGLTLAFAEVKFSLIPWCHSRWLTSRKSIFYSMFINDSKCLQIFYAFQVYLSPQNFSLASIALIQQTSQSLTWTFYHLFKDDKSFLQRLHEIKTISELGNIRNQVKDGELRYPAEALKPSSGMEVKFQSVSLLVRGYHNDL